MSRSLQMSKLQMDSLLVINSRSAGIRRALNKALVSQTSQHTRFRIVHIYEIIWCWRHSGDISVVVSRAGASHNLII